MYLPSKARRLYKRWIGPTMKKLLFFCLNVEGSGSFTHKSLKNQELFTSKGITPAGEKKTALASHFTFRNYNIYTAFAWVIGLIMDLTQIGTVKIWHSLSRTILQKNMTKRLPVWSSMHRCAVWWMEALSCNPKDIKTPLPKYWCRLRTPPEVPCPYPSS